MIEAQTSTWRQAPEGVAENSKIIQISILYQFKSGKLVFACEGIRLSEVTVGILKLRVLRDLVKRLSESLLDNKLEGGSRFCFVKEVYRI